MISGMCGRFIEELLFFGFCPLMNWMGKADFSVCVC